MFRFRTVLGWACALTAMLAGASAAAAQTERASDGMRFVPDVRGQFRALNERPETLGMNLGTTPEPSLCHHYQGIARVDAADGTPYFFMTKNGNIPDLAPFDFTDEAACAVLAAGKGETHNGLFLTFRMGSRDKHRERLRSNRQEKGRNLRHSLPLGEDVGTKTYTVTQSGLKTGNAGGAARPERVFQHPGGMQVVGHMLALAMDTPMGNVDFGLPMPRSQIMFFDVTDPESPQFTSKFVPQDHNNQVLGAADAVGVTPLPGGRHLLAIGSGFLTTIHFYRSRLDAHGVAVKLDDPELRWEYVGNATIPPPGVSDAHQNLQFLRQGDITGPLFLAGSRGYYPGVSYEQDRIDLYEVRCYTSGNVGDPDCAPTGSLDLGNEPVYNGRRLRPFPTSGGGEEIAPHTLGGYELADFAAAASFHVTPSGELLFYATTHDNAGPGGRVDLAEWRHIDIVRPDSPTYMPTAKVNGPYEVDEGGSVGVSGSASPPITQAWMQLFHEADFGGFDFESRSIVVDHRDYALDDYDDFFRLEKPFAEVNQNDQTTSLKWFAPTGCSPRVHDHYTDGDGNPQLDTRELTNDGTPRSIANLASINIDNGIDAVDFDTSASCVAYYDGFRLAWDLDFDGTFEAPGNAVSLSAAPLDGPAEILVRAQPQDGAGATPGPTTSAAVTVRNVAPTIRAPALTDPTGDQLGTAVPAGLPVTLTAEFSDPGRLDTQQATVDWGDGTVETTFDGFHDASFGHLGSLVHDHRYAAGTYTLRVTVTDDDGGSDTITRSVTVKPADLALSMKGPADLNVFVGTDARLTYKITVKNNGPGGAALVAVKDALPSTTQFVSASIVGGACQGPPAGSGGTVTCSLETMASGASATMTLVVKMRPTTLGIRTVTNTASVSAGSTDPVASNNAASARTLVVSLLNR